MCVGGSSSLAVCDCFHDASMLRPQNTHSNPLTNWINKQFRYQQCCRVVFSEDGRLRKSFESHIDEAEGDGIFFTSQSLDEAPASSDFGAVCSLSDSDAWDETEDRMSRRRKAKWEWWLISVRYNGPHARSTYTNTFFLKRQLEKTIRDLVTFAIGRFIRKLI